MARAVVELNVQEKQALVVLVYQCLIKAEYVRANKGDEPDLARRVPKRIYGNSRKHAGRLGVASIARDNGLVLNQEHKPLGLVTAGFRLEDVDQRIAIPLSGPRYRRCVVIQDDCALAKPLANHIKVA
ncbi:hypothetical protein D3H34_29890 [Acidovorax cavernicola]|uniref:Uncharacterized protein n=1 Tax=Acidovorax cavernicola TaxID=1675792 RepID=A0A9X8GSH9_9BURK|nr:hypothetical protein D3H34_29890 [Acidovorax cavernicola]